MVALFLPTTLCILVIEHCVAKLFLWKSRFKLLTNATRESFCALQCANARIVLIDISDTMIFSRQRQTWTIYRYKTLDGSRSYSEETRLCI